MQLSLWSLLCIRYRATDSLPPGRLLLSLKVRGPAANTPLAVKTLIVRGLEPFTFRSEAPFMLLQPRGNLDQKDKTAEPHTAGCDSPSSFANGGFNFP